MASECTDWQMHKSLVECSQHMLDHQLATDVRFRIETENAKSEEIGAHKYVLISRSPVFFAMLCGDLATDSTITITDVEMHAFKAVLRYAYCDQVSLNDENVMPILYASKKYLMATLSEKCIAFLANNMSVDNVCLIYQHSMLYDEDKLVQKCHAFIEMRTEDIVHSPSFLNIPQTTLLEIVSFDRLTISELDLFKMCSLWAIEECKRQDIEVNGENQRHALAEVLYHLHLPTLELKDFANVVAKTGILDAEEKCAIFEYMTADDKAKVAERLRFPLKIREQPLPSVLQRFTIFTKTSVYSGDCSIMKVHVDHAVLIKGFGISGSTNYDTLAEVQVNVKEDRMALCNSTITIEEDFSGDIKPVMLSEPVLLRPKISYTVIITFHFFGEHDQGSCRRGKTGAKALTCDGVTFEFDRPDSAGFIHQILFCRV